MTPKEIFIVSFGLTLVVIWIIKQPKKKPLLWTIEVAHCPKCGIELREIDLASHRCGVCGIVISKKTVEWKEKE